MKLYERLLSRCAITSLWIITSLGFSFAEGAELKPVVSTESMPEVKHDTPIYLTPSNYQIGNIIASSEANLEQYAHYSHSSHSSHYSHQSHTSHYSSAYTSTDYSSPSYSNATATYSKPVVTFSAEMQSIQKRLNELGYDVGTADGVNGQQTVQAIKKFQEGYDLDVDGMVGPNTRQALNSISLINVQQKLKQLGFNCNTNGVRDDNTIQAIKDFQNNNGIYADGVINKITKDALAL